MPFGFPAALLDFCFHTLYRAQMCILHASNKKKSKKSDCSRVSNKRYLSQPHKLRPFTISVIRLGATPMALARAFCDNLYGSINSSKRIFPIWYSFICLLFIFCIFRVQLLLIINNRIQTWCLVLFLGLSKKSSRRARRDAEEGVWYSFLARYYTLSSLSFVEIARSTASETTLSIFWTMD